MAKKKILKNKFTTAEINLSKEIVNLNEMLEAKEAHIKHLQEVNTILNEQYHQLLEDNKINRAKWREEANKKLCEILEQKNEELKAAQKPWYKRLF